MWKMLRKAKTIVTLIENKITTHKHKPHGVSCIHFKFHHGAIVVPNLDVDSSSLSIPCRKRKTIKTDARIIKDFSVSRIRW